MGAKCKAPPQRQDLSYLCECQLTWRWHGVVHLSTRHNHGVVPSISFFTSFTSLLMINIITIHLKIIRCTYKQREVPRLIRPPDTCISPTTSQDTSMIREGFVSRYLSKSVFREIFSRNTCLDGCQGISGDKGQGKLSDIWCEIDEYGRNGRNE
ncbi:hypothetical protein Syun_001877 [Stephania yunnanensis]|uniref:Uncharacterized protein n=1 Tax=Stephania yunnanensis TaxID=152371 RepID=A0AAP0LEH8_9MAGN